MKQRNRSIAATLLALCISSAGCQRGEVPTITPVPVNTPEPVQTEDAPEVQTEPLPAADAEPPASP
jgi:hypothetical protein